MKKKNKLHRHPTKTTNYNCEKCHKTCIFDVSRFGYVVRVIVTLSIYYWISEFGYCKICGCEGSHHKFENYSLSVGLRGEEIMNLLQKANNQHWQNDGTNISLEQLIYACKLAIKELIDQISKLAAEIDQLGITKSGEQHNLRVLVPRLSVDASFDLSFQGGGGGEFRTSPRLSSNEDQSFHQRISLFSNISNIDIENDQIKKCTNDHDLKLTLLNPQDSLNLTCNKCSDGLETISYRCHPCKYYICEKCYVNLGIA